MIGHVFASNTLSLSSDKRPSKQGKDTTTGSTEPSSYQTLLQGSGKRILELAREDAIASSTEPSSYQTLLQGSGKRILELAREDAIASSTDAQSFKQAVQSGNMETVWDVLKYGNDKLQEYCGKYLVSLEKPKLVKLVNRAEDFIKAWMLRAILIHAGQPLFDEVFLETRPSDFTLSCVACSAELACDTGKFIYLLGRITDKDDQEFAVTRGVEALFNAKKPECFDPLLFALENESSLGPRMANAAIQQAFREASRFDNRALAKRFFDHPAITAEIYSYALYFSLCSCNLISELFYWLLARADNQDLIAAKKMKKSELCSEQFLYFVNKASPVDISKTRQQMGRQERTDITESALDGLVAKDLNKLIIDYDLAW